MNSRNSVFQTCLVYFEIILNNNFSVIFMDRFVFFNTQIQCQHEFNYHTYTSN